MSIIKHVTLQKIVAHDFRYDPRRLVGRLTGRSAVSFLVPKTQRISVPVMSLSAFEGRLSTKVLRIVVTQNIIQRDSHRTYSSYQITRQSLCQHNSHSNNL